MLSQNVTECDISRWCSCILNSTWISATQHTTDNSKPDPEHKRSSVCLLFVCSGSSLSCCFIVTFLVINWRYTIQEIKCFLAELQWLRTARINLLQLEILTVSDMQQWKVILNSRTCHCLSYRKSVSNCFCLFWLQAKGINGLIIQQWLEVRWPLGVCCLLAGSNLNSRHVCRYALI